jgi:hypothetical protein
MINYRQATIEDVLELGPNLRECDVEELVLAAGPDYMNSLVGSIELAKGLTEAAIDPAGNVIAILGCCGVEDNKDIGIPFMVCSDAVDKYPKRVVRDAKQRTRLWSKKYPTLLNMVYAGNTKTIKWLEHIGYTIGELNETYGYAKAPFYLFYRIR